MFIPFPQRPIFYTDYSTKGGHEATLELLSMKKDFTALIGANDYIAIGALSALSQKQIKVPDEISVVGFTGDEIGSYAVPPLTTMVQPIEEIGTKAVQILLAQIKDPKHSIERILMPARLLKRSSVKKLTE